MSHRVKISQTAGEGRPILFSGPMVRAILDGSKTQTRRVVKRIAKLGEATEFGPSDTDGYDWHARDRRMLWNDLRHDDLLARCPYGQPGDLLYVRETWTPARHAPVFRADYPESAVAAGYDKYPPESDVQWKPSIHMPKALARLWLRVTDVRVERVQEITEEDALSEGVRRNEHPTADQPSATMCFAALWDSINASRGYGWDTNPWVWVVSFERATP